MTGLVPYAIEPLGTQHDRTAFSSGAEPLDRYFKQQAGQESRRHVANCFLGVHRAEKTIGGYYTLSATAVIFDDLPEEFRKKLPRYPEVPAALLGRLAVDLAHRRRGLGDFLLFDAMRRTLHADLAAAVLIVDERTSRPRAFTGGMGFWTLDQDAGDCFCRYPGSRRYSLDLRALSSRGPKAQCLLRLGSPGRLASACGLTLTLLGTKRSVSTAPDSAIPAMT